MSIKERDEVIQPKLVTESGKKEIIGKLVCPPSISRDINKKKYRSGIFLLLMVLLPVVILPLTFLYMSDGVVEIHVSNDFSFPQFNVVAINYSTGDCYDYHADCGDGNCDDYPWVNAFYCYRDYRELVIPSGGSDVLFKITDFRVCFTKIAGIYTSKEIMKALMYYDRTNPELRDEFDYNAIFVRNIAVSSQIYLSELRGINVKVRVPRNTYLTAIWIDVRSLNYTNPYDDAFFKTSFVTFFGKGDNNVVGFDKMIIDVNTGLYNDTAFRQWDWDSFWTTTHTTTPDYYPWTIETNIIHNPNNPDIFDPNII